MKTELQVGKLNEKALRGEELRLHPHVEMVRAHLELIINDLKQGIPPDQEDYEFLVCILEDYKLPARHFGPRVELLQARLCAAFLVDEAKKAYLAEHGGKRVRNQTLQNNLIDRAIAIVQPKFSISGSRGLTRDEINQVRKLPTGEHREALEAEVDRLCPDAREQMRAVWPRGAAR